MEKLKQETRMCVGDMQDIIKELLEVIAPGKLYTPFFTTLLGLVSNDSAIYDIEEFRAELRVRVDSFLRDVDKEKDERKLRVIL